jgi:predicted transcriptional regulator
MADANTTVERTSVKLDAEMIRKAKHIATADDSTISEVIEQEAKTGIDRRYKRVISKAGADLNHDLGDPGA